MDPDWFLSPRNFLGLPEGLAAFDAAQVLVLPVPYDATTSYRAGTREGPQAIIDASQQVEWFDHELKRETAEVGIHTLPEVAPVMSGPADMVERLYQVARRQVDTDKLLVTLGGEHSLSSAVVRAFSERYPGLTVLQFDAHADLRDSYEETPYSHASVARRIVEMCPLTQVGIRSLSKEEWAFLQTRPPITTFFIESHPLSESDLERLVGSLGSEVYVTLDIDALDPGLVPGVGTPEPGGLTWQETLRILRRVAEARRVVGFDLMEYCPPEGNTAAAFTAAKLAYKAMGYFTHPWKE